MHLTSKGFIMLKTKPISRIKQKKQPFSNLKIDLKIFDKSGKIQSNKMIDLSTILKNFIITR